jgi:adenylate kinase family enzyme
MLRAAVVSGTETGKKVQEIINKGELVPNELVVNLM